MQNDMMPQFGVKAQAKTDSQAQPQTQSQPQAQPEGFGSATPELEREKVFTSLKREQILPVLTVIFGFLALIFLVSTIALAVKKPSSTSMTVESSSSSSAEVPAVSTLMFSTNKISDPISDANYRFGAIVRNADGHQVVAAFANNSGSGFTIDVNWEFVAPYYGVNSSRVDQESFKVMTNEVVADMVVGRATNDVKDDVLLLLLANGKVQYMPLRESLEKYSFKIVGEFDDISDAVKFYRVQETVNGETIETTMVQKTDGT
ncbi:hypothetical protein IJG78_03260, partial [Candidatus Saccharibacteria bacterium]|nr:hypothetical protein [Candidatus Saccharibacteria bacterium]